jgi:hypothetical protein
VTFLRDYGDLTGPSRVVCAGDPLEESLSIDR